MKRNSSHGLPCKELPSDVKMFLESTFPAHEISDAMEMLSLAKIEDGTIPSPRLLRCAALAAAGSLKRLSRLSAMLAIDWRDVVVAGECKLKNGELVHVRDHDQPLQV